MVLSLKVKMVYACQDALDRLVAPLRGLRSRRAPKEDGARKKIAIACSHFWPSVGGLENRLEQFGCELVRAGYDVTVLTPERLVRAGSCHKGIRIVSISPTKRVPVALGWPYAVRRAVLSGEYRACILVQQPQAEIIWSIEGVTPPPQTRVIVQPIINEDGYSRWKDDPLFVGRLATLLKGCSAVVALTRTGPDRRFMAGAGIVPVLLPNAATLVPGSDGFRSKHGIPEESFLVLHVANHYWVKNHLGLLRTLHPMPSSWRLVLIGNPTGEPDCAEVVSAELATRPEVLHLTGLDRQGVAAAMKAADVVVLASLGEGAPNTILEAMSHRKPWLATPQCGAANEHAGGIICPLPEFPRHLAALQESPLLRRGLGDLGNRHWQESYVWPKVMEGWIDLIEGKNVAGDPSAPSSIYLEMAHLRVAVARQVALAGEVPRPEISARS